MTELNPILQSCRDYLISHDILDLTSGFTAYCELKGIRRVDMRRKDNAYTYHIESKAYYGAKCECMIYKDTAEWGNTRLYIVMRKKNGIPYLIIGRNNGERYAEVGIDTVWEFDESNLKTLITEFPQLFDYMGIRAN